jgi:transcriptional antiterminator NusG
MIITDDSWYFIRNTPKVTGFVGVGTTPMPVSEEELKDLFQRMNKEEPEVETDFKIGDLVEIIQGLFKGTKGKIVEIDAERQRLKILVPIMNRETPVEVDFLQVRRL